MQKPEEMTDLIYFAIKASRTTGKDRIHHLKRLKELCKAEIEFENAKLEDTKSIFKE